MFVDDTELMAGNVDGEDCETLCKGDQDTVAAWYDRWVIDKV